LTKPNSNIDSSLGKRQRHLKERSFYCQASPRNSLRPQEKIKNGNSSSLLHYALLRIGQEPLRGVGFRQEASRSVSANAELVARAYSLGESNVTDVLTVRRLALESGLAASVAQLDANEARYRLLLDAHQLWQKDDHSAEKSH